MLNSVSNWNQDIPRRANEKALWLCNNAGTDVFLQQQAANSSDTPPLSLKLSKRSMGQHTWAASEASPSSTLHLQNETRTNQHKARSALIYSAFRHEANFTHHRRKHTIMSYCILKLLSSYIIHKYIYMLTIPHLFRSRRLGLHRLHIWLCMICGCYLHIYILT